MISDLKIQWNVSCNLFNGLHLLTRLPKHCRLLLKGAGAGVGYHRTFFTSKSSLLECLKIFNRSGVNQVVFCFCFYFFLTEKFMVIVYFLPWCAFANKLWKTDAIPSVTYRFDWWSVVQYMKNISDVNLRGYVTKRISYCIFI